MRRAALGLVVLLGCYQDLPTDIPCDGDLSCPTDYWCTSAGTCSELSKSSPPELVLEGASASASGPFGASVTIPRSGGQVALQVHNRGGAEAAYPDITLAGPACFDLDGTIGSNLVGIIGPGERAVARQTAVRPTAPCPDAVVSVELKLSQGPSSRRFERVWTGSFTAVLGP